MINNKYGTTINYCIRVCILFLIFMNGSGIRSLEPQSEVEKNARAHFEKARAIEHSKEMYKFSKPEFDALLAEYESGLESLIAEAEKNLQSPASLRLVDQALGSLRSYANHALRKYKYDWVFDYWDRIRKIKKDAPIEAEFASAMGLQAHSALAEEKYDEAIRIFSEMGDISRKGSYGKLSMESYHPEFYEQIARRSNDLAKENVKPQYTVKVFSLRVGLLRFKWKEKGLNGETSDVSSSPMKIKKGDAELAEMSEKALRRTILAMSDGKLDLTFDRQTLVDPLEIILPDSQRLPNGVTQSPSLAGDDIIDRAAGEVGTKLRERAKANDVVILFWWGTSPLTQHGGARQFKIEGQRKLRGNINIGVQFYHYSPEIDYMNCGSCPGPNAIGFYPHVYVHEFFHVMEARFGIKPVHGFTEPKRFPAWKGSDEVDYYWWQIRENIPSLKTNRKLGDWRDFSFM